MYKRGRRCVVVRDNGRQRKLPARSYEEARRIKGEHDTKRREERDCAVQYPARESELVVPEADSRRVQPNSGNRRNRRDGLGVRVGDGRDWWDGVGVLLRHRTLSITRSQRGSAEALEAQGEAKANSFIRGLVESGR